MRGSLLKPNDLIKAGIIKAHAVVILTNPTASSGTAEGMMDADTIFIYKTIRHMNRNVRIITELTSIDTISLLSGTQKVTHYLLSEPFAGGEIFISQMLDALTCQCYYNPYIIEIFKQMMMGGAMSSDEEILEEYKLRRCNLFLVKVSKQYIASSAKFEDVFRDFLIDKKYLSLGILRKNINNKSFVFLNPPPDTTFRAND